MGHISLSDTPQSDHPSLEPDIMQLVFTLYSAQLALSHAHQNLDSVEQKIHHAALLDPTLVPRTNYAYDAFCQTLALSAPSSALSPPPASARPSPSIATSVASLASFANPNDPDVLDYDHFKAAFVRHFPGSEHLFPGSTRAEEGPKPEPNSPSLGQSDSLSNQGNGDGTSAAGSSSGPRVFENDNRLPARLIIPNGGAVFVPSPPILNSAEHIRSYFPTPDSAFDKHDFDRSQLPVPRSLPGMVPRSHPYPHNFVARPYGNLQDSAVAASSELGKGKRRASVDHTDSDPSNNLSLIVAAAESASRSTIPTPTSPDRRPSPRVPLDAAGHGSGRSTPRLGGGSAGVGGGGSSAMQLLLRASSDAVDANYAAEWARSNSGGDYGSGNGSESGPKRMRQDFGSTSDEDLEDDYDDEDMDDGEEYDDGREPAVARTAAVARSKPRSKPLSRVASRAGSVSSLVGEGGNASGSGARGRGKGETGFGRGKARRQPRSMEYDPSAKFVLNTKHHFLVVQTKFGQPELSDRACTELFLNSSQIPADSPYGRTVARDNKATYSGADYAEDVSRRSVYTLTSSSGSAWIVTFTANGPTIAPSGPGGVPVAPSPGTIYTFIHFPPKCFVHQPSLPLGSLPWWRIQACVGLSKHRGMPGPDGAWTARYDKDPRDRRPARIVEHYARCRWRSDDENAALGGDPVGRLARAVLGTAGASKE